MDAQGNENVALAFYGLHGAITDFKLMECDDDVKRYLYEVPSYQIANQFIRSQQQMSTKYKIFTSKNDGKPKDWTKIVGKSKKPTLASVREASDKKKIKLGAMMPKHRK